MKYPVVAIEYFTKWIEAEPVTQITTHKVQHFVAEESNEERKVNLDLLDIVREEARIKAKALKRRVEYKYSSKLRPRQFQVVDLVMR